MDARLWPARNIAEHAFCPRLFYLMEVEGLHEHNADTLKGLHVHRTVDAPSKIPPVTKSAEPIPGSAEPVTLRSLTLTSDARKLTATLDLTSLEGSLASPVEYRKGNSNRFGSNGKAGPWPVDRAQLGLQAILLEDNGYTVETLVAYYAEEKIRLEFPFSEEIRLEALAVFEAAKTTAAGARPLPLLNDPRCVGCSMQPVCLPDEVNHLLGRSPSPRKIWPPLDEGIQVVAQTNALKIGIRGDALRVTQAPSLVSADFQTREIPLASVESLSVLGHVQVTTQAIHALATARIPVSFRSSAGRLLAILDPMDATSARIRSSQVRMLDKPERALILSRELIASKISNQRTLLGRNHPDLPKGVLDALATQEESARKATSPDSLRGHEGQAAALYFAAFGGIFSSPFAEEFQANGRKRRPPPDPINSVLSLVYTILTHECVAALKTAGLEPSIGAFHSSLPGRPAFALDLLEPFRPLVGDSVTISLFNRGELGPGHFSKTAAGCLLTDHGRRAFFDAYSRRMDTSITHPTFGYRLSYRRMIILHARMIAAWITGEFDNLSFLTTR